MELVKKHPLKVDYYFELESWVRDAILEAEKNKDSSRKNRLLSLLKDLDIVQEQ